ncbi:hypothetical protein BZARG_3012 [Bizionia argentinensis JUB59]|uniref:Lipoprotein n=1 Tax=Bizionia argentinensis JUB59 TaxID=1046627 RepID=G2EFZ2_9FLAO|nr:hypothetical protein [Bizionia argentinensis]EGV42649.2 hypothetical protein BZARG_3012 [Bizionia argentinensis JUB59]
MKKIKITVFIISLLTLTSCEIVQETRFEANGSGKYSLGFDLSEMMKMGGGTESGEKNKQLDTLIVFSEFLVAKKDSISKLSKEKQDKIKQLEKFSLYVKADSVSKKFEMKISYDFDNIAELKLFGEKLKGQNIKELELLSDKTKDINKDEDSGIPDFNKSYNTTFNKDMFSVKITPEGIAEAEKTKDTTMTKDNPMADLIRFKSRYLFPYKIENVDNENVRILPSFKGIEISGNLFEINNNPKFFDVNIEFEHE